MIAAYSIHASGRRAIYEALYSSENGSYAGPTRNPGHSSGINASRGLVHCPALPGAGKTISNATREKNKPRVEHTSLCNVRHENSLKYVGVQSQPLGGWCLLVTRRRVRSQTDPLQNEQPLLQVACTAGQLGMIRRHLAS
ncbi:hypothetical protein LIA77_06463 [Sarocladium implicatum]|nr:hypothetical protein LIA77_06463 [Sarocladium implicatum]